MNKYDEKYYTSLAMRKYGGGFVQSLGAVITHSDPSNYQKIKDTFPGYFNKYKHLGRKLYEEKKDK